MRAVLAIVFILASGFFVATATSRDCKFPHFVKHRTKLREIRGFKPEYISTAIGFGKRVRPAEGTPDFGNREEILSPTLRNLPHGVPAEVLLRAMQANPAFAGMLMRLSMRNDRGDEESTMDRWAKPERTLASF